MAITCYIIHIELKCHEYYSWETVSTAIRKTFSVKIWNHYVFYKILDRHVD